MAVPQLVIQRTVGTRRAMGYRRHALTNWMTTIILRLSNRSMTQATPRMGRMLDPERPNQPQKRALERAGKARTAPSGKPLRAADELPAGGAR